MTLRRSALQFVILLGMVSLLSDMTYESARSINGPYLGMLGASATVVGTVAGLGEFIGLALRLVFGWLSDRTGRYWDFTLVGYGINLMAVPLLALAGHWEMAAALLIFERLGKAIRTPARDAMLSYATSQTGHGWGFGLHEAMDQIGAILGPLAIAFVLSVQRSYRIAFAILLAPALLALATLLVARMRFPQPRDLEKKTPILTTRGVPKGFWIYLLGIALIGAGYVDFPLIAYHFSRTSDLSPAWIPILYAIAMGVDAVAALLFGYEFDRHGLIVLSFSTLLSAFFPLLIFARFPTALLGVILWGVGMGAQESIMRAAVGKLVSPDKRGTAYGLVNTGYGLAWFLGSMSMGILYDLSLPVLVLFSFVVQIAAVPLFLWLHRTSSS